MPSTRMTPPSGAQHRIAFGNQVAVVVEVGGGLRSFTAGGRALVDGYGEEEACPGAAGAILAPWPGRVEDGSYSFRGETYQLPLTEGEAGTSLHGLVRTLPWHRLEGSATHVVLQCELAPSPGYPFPLSLSVRWELGGRGLTAAHRVVNRGTAPCPFGLGVHPYLGGTTSSVDDLRVTLAAARVDEMNQRNLPVGTLPVEQVGLDFRPGARIGTRAIDHTFSELATAPGDRMELLVDEPDGHRTVLWFQPPFRYLHLFSSHSLTGPRRRRSLAVEPMTCPGNAFRSGRDLLTIEPGAAVEARWGIETGGGSGGTAAG